MCLLNWQTNIFRKQNNEGASEQDIIESLDHFICSEKKILKNYFEKVGRFQYPTLFAHTTELKQEKRSHSWPDYCCSLYVQRFCCSEHVENFSGWQDLSGELEMLETHTFSNAETKAAHEFLI